MSKTVNYRRQHKEILELITVILNNLESENFKENSKEIRSMLAKLAGKLKIHLAMEDKVLYPELLNNKKAEVKALAQIYLNEVGGLKEQFTNYINKWPRPTDIEKTPELFKKETVQIFDHFKKRIIREENELYDIYDRLT